MYVLKTNRLKISMIGNTLHKNFRAVAQSQAELHPCKLEKLDVSTRPLFTNPVTYNNKIYRALLCYRHGAITNCYCSTVLQDHHQNQGLKIAL